MVKISIHAPRTGSDRLWRKHVDTLMISIHAPRTGSDFPAPHQSILPLYFNPRSPHGERPCWISAASSSLIFQSTLPARGATEARQPQTNHCTISIHAPRTGSDGGLDCFHLLLGISIHAPRTGSDTDEIRYSFWLEISIHAPRTGSDDDRIPVHQAAGDFNPRSPHGERRIVMPQGRTRGDFNPRSPHGERRLDRQGGGDSTPHFNPRSPHGERHGTGRNAARRRGFQSTLPARGATRTG